MRSLTVRSLYTILAGAVCLGAAAPVRAQKTLDAFAQRDLRDVAASVRVLSKNDRELGKIGKGYVDAYKLQRQEIWCKEPGMVRFQGKKGLFTIRYVTNGNRKLTEVPTLHIRNVDNIAKEPSKGDTIVDLGVITPSWVDRVESRWLRTDTRDGKRVEVFEFWYKEDPKRRHTISVDPATKTILEMIVHHRARKKQGHRRRLVYGEVKEVSGVTMPTRVHLYNGENKLSADMRYESVRVNSGLDDRMFRF